LTLFTWSVDQVPSGRTVRVVGNNICLLPS
jgi:hypothetical protein